MVRSSIRGTAAAIAALGLLGTTALIRRENDTTESSAPTPNDSPIELAPPPERETVPERLRYVPPRSTGYDIHKIGAKTRARMEKAKARQKESG